MGVLTIRNVDEEVIAALKARAKVNHRSLEGELRFLLGRFAAPGPTLGAVRERVRMAAGYRADATIGRTGATAAGRAEDPCAVEGSVGEEWMGAMADVGEIVGDIVSPAAEPVDWDALRATATAGPGSARKR